MMNGSSNTMVEYQVLLFFKRNVILRKVTCISFTPFVELGHHFYGLFGRVKWQKAD